MERYSVRGIDPQKPIDVIREYTEDKIGHSELDSFNNPQGAEEFYKFRKREALINQGVSFIGGYFAGIGLRLIAEANSDYQSKPEFFLGLMLVGVGALVVRRAFDAVDKYDIAKIKLDQVRNWKNSFKAEEIAYQEPIPIKSVIVEETQIESEVKEKINEAPIVAEPSKQKKARTRTSSAGKRSTAKSPRIRVKSAVSKVDQVSQKITEDIEKHRRFMSQMIEENNKELEFFGFIPSHRCIETKCMACRRESNLIFI